MAILNRTETAQFLKERDRFVILTHRRPDGDTLGCAAFLCRGLRQLGKNAWILPNPEITPKYEKLHEGLTRPLVEEGDTLVAVDTASEQMLPEAYRSLLGSIDLRIDHHGTANSFTENELVDPEAAACGEILYDVLQLMGAKLDTEMANALYTAVSTDTGCFRYANTTDHSFSVAAACAAVSKDLFRLNQVYFDTNSLARLRLQGWMVENGKFLAGGKIVICAIPYAVERELGVTEDDMENISGFPRSIEGVHIAATLRQNADGLVKLSVRAIPGYDAGAICATFGGGGHKGAAGANMRLSLGEAVVAVEKAMPKICN